MAFELYQGRLSVFMPVFIIKFAALTLSPGASNRHTFCQVLACVLGCICAIRLSKLFESDFAAPLPKTQYVHKFV